MGEWQKLAWLQAKVIFWRGCAPARPLNQAAEPSAPAAAPARIRVRRESEGSDASGASSAPKAPQSAPWAQRLSWVLSIRSEEHTSELQSQSNLVCRLLLEKKKTR